MQCGVEDGSFTRVFSKRPAIISGWRQNIDALLEDEDDMRIPPLTALTCHELALEFSSRHFCGNNYAILQWLEI